MKKITLFLLLLLIPSVLGETSSCYNVTHRQISREIIIDISGTVYNITSSELEHCPYGCVEETGLCRSPIYWQVAVVVSLFILALLVYLIIRSVM